MGGVRIVAANGLASVIVRAAVGAAGGPLFSYYGARYLTKSELARIGSRLPAESSALVMWAGTKDARRPLEATSKLNSRTWEDFLALRSTEIREYGSTSTQVTRRPRALLEGLMRSADPANRASIQSQLDQFEAILEEDVSDPVRRAYASISDRQGLGGRK